MHITHPRRGFALIELIICVGTLTAAVLIAALLLPDARRRARLAGSIVNLQQLGAAAHAFAADNDNRIFSFTWAPGPHSCSGYTFPSAPTAVQAAADQAVCILRERAGRTDIQAIQTWIPHISYNHLMLIDYLNEGLPSPVVVSPGDAGRVSWQRAVRSAPADQGQAYFALQCRPPGNANQDKRWPYSSSYEMGPAFFSPDALVNTPEGPIPTIAQDAGGHGFYTIGTSRTVLGNRRMDEIRYPSHKVMMFETAQRFFGNRELFFANPEARIPMVFSDASASVRSTNRANAGFFPNTPLSANPTRINYTPGGCWEPPTSNGSTSELHNGVFRWTRSGLRGRDFQGTEIPWVP